MANRCQSSNQDPREPLEPRDLRPFGWGSKFCRKWDRCPWFDPKALRLHLEVISSRAHDDWRKMMHNIRDIWLISQLQKRCRSCLSKVVRVDKRWQTRKYTKQLWQKTKQGKWVAPVWDMRHVCSYFRFLLEPKKTCFRPRSKPKAFRASSKNIICTFPLQLFGKVCRTSANNMCAQRASCVVLGLQGTSPSPGLSIRTCPIRSMHFEWDSVRDEKGRPASLCMIDSLHRTEDSIWCNAKTTTSCAAAETRSEASRDPTMTIRQYNPQAWTLTGCIDCNTMEYARLGAPSSSVNEPYTSCSSGDGIQAANMMTIDARLSPALCFAKSIAKVHPVVHIGRHLFGCCLLFQQSQIIIREEEVMPATWSLLFHDLIFSRPVDPRKPWKNVEHVQVGW